jgi:predicted nucleic acid-binding protein
MKIQLIGCQEGYDEFKEKLEEERIKDIASDFLFPKEKLLLHYRTVVTNYPINVNERETNYVKNDTDDDIFVWLAKSVKAGIIVSEDHHLKNLKSIDGICILNTQEFLNIYNQSLSEIIDNRVSPKVI